MADRSIPTILVTPRKQWWAMVIGGGVLCAGSLAAIFLGGDQAAIFLAAFFAFWAVLGAVMLLPGANSLRLDADGFEVEHFFSRKRYRWDDVSDFAVRNVGQYNEQLVAFDTAAEVRRSLWEKINGAAIGKGGYLPHTYGMAADELARLMTERKMSARK